MFSSEFVCLLMSELSCKLRTRGINTLAGSSTSPDVETGGTACYGLDISQKLYSYAWLG